MPVRDDEFAALLKRTLDADTHDIDPSTVQELSRLRTAVLAKKQPQYQRYGMLVPGFAFGAAALGVVALVGLPQQSVPRGNPETLLTELALEEDDIELVEDLDFYRWLEANGYAG